MSGELGAAHRAVINERPNQSRHHLSVTTFTCQPPAVTPPASAACATSRLVIRAAQTLAADGHRSWLGVDARERHQETRKEVHSFPLSAIGARRLKSFVMWSLTLKWPDWSNSLASSWRHAAKSYKPRDETVFARNRLFTHSAVSPCIPSYPRFPPFRSRTLYSYEIISPRIVSSSPINPETRRLMGYKANERGADCAPRWAR